MGVWDYITGKGAQTPAYTDLGGAVDYRNQMKEQYGQDSDRYKSIQSDINQAYRGTEGSDDPYAQAAQNWGGISMGAPAQMDRSLGGDIRGLLGMFNPFKGAAGGAQSQQSPYMNRPGAQGPPAPQSPNIWQRIWGDKESNKQFVDDQSKKFGESGIGKFLEGAEQAGQGPKTGVFNNKDGTTSQEVYDEETGTWGPAPPQRQQQGPPPKWYQQQPW